MLETECTKCLALSTKTGITFDEEGICNVCREFESKRDIDWASRKNDLLELCDKYRGGGQYDCLVPFSGGKDSTYQLWYVVNELKMKPLVVSFDHGFFRKKHLENRERTLKKLGCDFVTVRANYKVVKEIIPISIKECGEFCWHCHTGVYGAMTQMAVRYGIPLVFWGQATAEYGTYGSHGDIEEIDKKQYDDRFTLGVSVDKMLELLPDWVTEQDMSTFRYPEVMGLKSVRLGSFIPWDLDYISDLIKEELGWEGNEVEGVAPKFWYEKVECKYQPIRDYLIYKQKGFGRTRHLCSIAIREGKMDKDEARKLIDQYDGKIPKVLQEFESEFGIQLDNYLTNSIQCV